MTETRREFVLGTSAAAGAVLAQNAGAAAASGPFWPNGARLAILFSLVWESGAEPPSTLAPPPGSTATGRFPNYPGDSQVRYGYLEGVPRLLELYARHNINVTAFVCGKSAETNPALAKEIAQRGHEIAAHGYTHGLQYHLSRDDERTFIANNVTSLVKTTGQTPKGYNCRGQQRSPNTLELLAEQGFTYTIDDYARDEPYLVTAGGKPFAMVPFTVTGNDVGHFNRGGSIEGLERILRDEFDVLYAEGATRRRMMVISTHDEVAGRAARIALFDRFLDYAKRKPGVWFARSGEVAQFALTSPATIRESA